MLNTKKTDLKPYTSEVLYSLKEGNRLFEKILSSKTVIEPRKADKPIVLYGAGCLGKMAKNFFNHLNMPFLYVVDKNAVRCGLDKIWTGVDILHPDEVREKDRKNCLLVVCVVTSPLIALRDELKAAGWKDISFFYDVCEAYGDRYPLSNGWFLGNLGDKEIEKVKKVFHALDDLSRMHYLQFLAWRKLRVELLGGSVNIDGGDRFFISEVTDVINSSEVFVDCGAHVGEVSKKFSEIAGGRYARIYAIEADKNSFAILKNNLRRMPNSSVSRHALGDKNGKGNFYRGFDFASKLNKSGLDKVDIVTLDGLKVPATFIKMHLEGGELDALKGAAGVIRKYRPIMAVTIYHNPDGVWKIPLFLIDNTNDYVYHLRLHSWAGTGAVFYAIPKEKPKFKGK